MKDRVHELSQRVRGVGRGTAATILARVADVAATYGFYAVIAHAVSVADFGRLILGITICQTVATVTRVGLDQALLTVQPSGSANRFVAKIVGAIAIPFALAALFPLPSFARWLAASVPAMALGQLVIGALRAGGHVTTAAAAEGLVQPASAFAFALAVSRVHPSPASFALALFASWLVTLLFAFRLEWRGRRLDRQTASSILHTGKSMLGVMLVNQAAASADVILLGVFASAVELGRYAAAQKIAAAFLLLHGAVAASVTPYMRALSGDPPLLQSYYRTVTRWSLTAGLPLLVVTAGVPAFILQLFGSEYARGSTVPLLILATSATVLLLSGPGGSVLLCSGRAGELFRVSAIGAFALAAGVAALARFGAIGAAIGVLCGRMIGRGLLIAAVRRVGGTEAALDPPMLLILGSGALAVCTTRVLAPSVGDVAAAAIGCVLALAGALAVLMRTGDIAVLRAELFGS